MAIPKEQRAAEAAKHISFVKGLFASETEASVQAAKIYEDGEGRELALPETERTETATSVTTAFTVDAVLRAQGKTLVVDPGSFTRPGGTYEDGAFGPEQALCAESNLYPILQGLRKAYYDKNRGFARGQLFTDRAVYIPEVVFNRKGQMKNADVLVVPEPNRQRALENHRSEKEADGALAARIETILAIASANEVDTLVLGAFGCGRMGWPAPEVIELFQKWLAEHPGAVNSIVFAVPRVHEYLFNEAFGKPAPVVEEAPQEEEEEEDLFDPNDLPEGVTLR